MRLSPFDEFPFHQHPAPFTMPATTDSHFNDGYWFAFYAPGWYVFSSLRLHPNVNVVDGAVSVAHDDRQRAVRASRALRPRAHELSVGPLAVEIVEPMRRVRLALGPNPSGVELEVELVTQAPPFAEQRYQHVKFGALVNDTVRYTSVVRATGRLVVDGEHVAVDEWHGIRDHSWGVRSSMGVPTRIGGVDRTQEEADERALRLWVPFQCGDVVGMVNTHEDAQGRTLDLEGRLDHADGRAVPLVAVEHDLEYLPGTQRPVGGHLELVDATGTRRRFRLRASGTPADVHAIGYYRGWHDGLGAGVYRGAEVLETDDYDTTPGDEPTGPPHVPVRHRMGPTEYPMSMTQLSGPEVDGAGPAPEGMAHLEHYVFGRYDRYGFSGEKR